MACGLLLLTVLGGEWGRHAEEGAAGPDFLCALRLPFRGWAEADLALAQDDRAMLQPEAVLLRRYLARDGRSVEVAVVAGRRKRTVHTPAFCMAGGGWETVTQRRVLLPLPGGGVPASQALMSRDGATLIVTYFFTNGSYSTDDLMRFQTTQMVRRITERAPLGALVRLRVPITTEADAEALTQEFARASLPEVLSRLKTQGGLK